jgi:predicted TIM-barrel fold metal-dependent hydrolase
MALARAALFGVVLVVAMDTPARPQPPAAAERPPIIDMHIHAFGWDHQGDPPPPNRRTGRAPAARTDREAMEATLTELKRYNVVKAVAAGPVEHVRRWHAADPDRILGGVKWPLPDIDVLREEHEAGRLAVLAELALIYEGMAPTDPQLEPYWAFAEEADIPVGIHTGLGPPNTPYECCPKFRVSLGNPLLLEELLVRRPKLRIYMMHAGWPYLAETLAIMHMYPQVYVDLGAIDWLGLPREEFHEYLRALVRAGFAKRVMFGSDQMIWPEGIGLAIEGVESAAFLTDEQRRDIFYGNAVRFLRLDEKTLEPLPRKSPARRDGRASARELWASGRLTPRGARSSGPPGSRGARAPGRRAEPRP